MRNPNLACDLFKILLTEHISNVDTNDDCFTTYPDRFLDKYKINELITSSFKLSDQLLARVDEDPEWKGMQAKAKEAQLKAQQQQAVPMPEPAPHPTKPEPKKA